MTTKNIDSQTLSPLVCVSTGEYIHGLVDQVPRVCPHEHTYHLCTAQCCMYLHMYTQRAILYVSMDAHTSVVLT